MRNIENYQKDYLDNPFEDQMLTFRHRKTLETMQQYPTSSILEIGCGLRPIYDYYADFDKLTIVEPSSTFCEQASQRAPANVEIVNDYFTAPMLPRLSARYDLIVISSLLHELEKPDEMLADVWSLADNETVVHINVPNARSLHRQIALNMGMISELTEKSPRQIRFQQHHTYDLDSIQALVKTCGFNVIEAETFFLKPFTHGQMQSMLDAGLISTDVLEGLYAVCNDLPGLGAEIMLNVRKGNQIESTL
jgi:2-polyprenyl-3-methyl-5-hydroxy-6-metoxy-1,4-benzoquinol methylase